MVKPEEISDAEVGRPRARHRHRDRGEDGVPRPGEGRGDPREPCDRHREVGGRAACRTPAISGGAEPADGGLVDFVARVVGEGPLRVEETLGATASSASASPRRNADRRSTTSAASRTRSIELLRNARDAQAPGRSSSPRPARGDRRTLHRASTTARESPRPCATACSRRASPRSSTRCRWTAGVSTAAGWRCSPSARTPSRRVSAPRSPAGAAPFRSLSTAPPFPNARTSRRGHAWARARTAVPPRSRGPHNIVRTAVEFALESRGAVDVYLGTPAEIACGARRGRVRPSGRPSRVFRGRRARRPADLALASLRGRCAGACRSRRANRD